MNNERAHAISPMLSRVSLTHGTPAPYNHPTLMTQAQAEAHFCGLVPHEHDPRFFAQHLVPYVFLKPRCVGKRVLEVGFGEGYGANELAETAEAVVGVDIAPGNIPRAAATYPRPNLTFRQIEGTHLPFPEKSFEIVCSFQVIEHIPEADLHRYLAEISRVLKHHGTFYVSTLNLEHNQKPGQPYQKLIYHEKEFTAQELHTLLREVFPVVELYGVHLTTTHRLYQRLKKWGLNRLGPPSMNPIARFYDSMTPAQFRVTPWRVRDSLDLFACCQKI